MPHKTDVKTVDPKTGGRQLDSGDIVSMVAHELKNPLSSIRGYTELLLNNAVGDLNPQQRQFLTTIQANADRMGNLIADLSDVSLVDSNRLKLDFSTFSIIEQLTEITRFLIPQFNEKNLTFSTEAKSDIFRVVADKKRAEQVIINLIGNAAKYTLPGGKIKVLISQISRNGNDFVQTAIEDSGIGIKEDDKQWIFHQYYRTDDVQSRDIPGTGLGLYISKRLVELMGGTIWFESVYNQGSTFYFTLPGDKKSS